MTDICSIRSYNTDEKHKNGKLFNRIITVCKKLTCMRISNNNNFLWLGCHVPKTYIYAKFHCRKVPRPLNKSVLFRRREYRGTRLAEAVSLPPVGRPVISFIRNQATVLGRSAPHCRSSLRSPCMQAQGQSSTQPFMLWMLHEQCRKRSQPSSGVVAAVLICMGTCERQPFLVSYSFGVFLFCFLPDSCTLA